jgi:two-component system, chemotaxis family, protein-glutamate methylesterase/glutaminase
MIKVLIADNSKTVQDFLVQILTSDPDIQIAGVVLSGQKAVEFARSNKPDIITIAVNMPGPDGFEIARAIMEIAPVPIVMVSSIKNDNETLFTNRYIESGALAIIRRPEPSELAQFPDFHNELIRTVKLMSEIKVVKLFPRNRNRNVKTFASEDPFKHALKRVKVIAIGASTGGPLALQTILSRITGYLPVPVLIVQHIAPGFVNVFQKMLSATSGIHLKIAIDGEKILPGIGYIAPDNFHMGVTRGEKIQLSNKPPENGSKPSVSYLFRSVAQVYGPNSLGVLLTGMGKDGADELKDMKDQGAITVVQNEGSSVVFGMPGEAIKVGASENAFSLERIAEIILKSGSKN